MQRRQWEGKEDLMDVEDEEEEGEYSDSIKENTAWPGSWHPTVPGPSNHVLDSTRFTVSSSHSWLGSFLLSSN